MKVVIKRRVRRTEVASKHALHLPRFRRQEKVAVAVCNHLGKNQSRVYMVQLSDGVPCIKLSQRISGVLGA
jgi:hypothetical protein